VQEQAELREIVTDYIQDHPNLASHPSFALYIRRTFVHHAGMLPSWKAMVEKLFQRGFA